MRPVAALGVWGAQAGRGLAVELCVFAAVAAALAVANSALVRLLEHPDWTRPPTGSGDVS